MPELPEVETIKNVLKPVFVNNTILKVDVINKNTIDGDPLAFARVLEGKIIKDITRVGKYLVFHLSDDIVFISHLRMEGKYFEYKEGEHNSAYVKVVFHLDNNKKVCYDDSRGFGKMKLSNESTFMKEKELAKLGKEPFYVDDVKPLMAKVKNSNIPIKTALLDQTLITGLGNIYVDETLYACKIHPHTPARLITKEEWDNIIKESSRILNNAIKSGGSTIKSYHPGKGIDGNFQSQLLVYGKKDTACPRCGKTFRFTKTNGRGTTYCPCCQQKLGKTITVGLTGKVSSGKSTVAALFKKNGADVISCDSIVADLYKQKEIASKIERLFNIKFKDEIVDKQTLLNYLLTHTREVVRLQRLIFPYVIKEVEAFLSSSKSKLKLVEAPLLFEANMESMFDVIIGVEISPKLQQERIIERNGEKGLLLLELNRSSKYEENKNKAEFLVSNNSTLGDLENEVLSLINKLKSRLG